jgi:diguanylate cyclase (GGDEF)-like protein
MPLSIGAKKKKAFNTVDMSAYALVFICFNGFLGWLFYQTLPLKNEFDFWLIGLYGLLSLASYYYFILNDILASHLKGRSMALGFLFAHGAFTFIGFAQIFLLPVSMVWYISGGLLLAAYVFGAYGTNRFSRYNSETRERMRLSSETDELTGLFNRRHYSRYSQRLIDNLQSKSKPLSVIMFDLDDFKQINDDLGHAAGDVVLIEISRIMLKNLRKSDFAYRWGGEEFLVLLPQADTHDGKQVADKIIQQVANKSIFYHDHDINITISAGLTEYALQDSNLQQTIKRADRALYQAKQQGKNKAVVARSKVGEFTSEKNNP